MSEDQSREHDQQQKVQRAEQSTRGPEGSLAPENAPSYPTSLLSDPRLNGRGNGPVRTSLMLQAQQTYGNRAVQRYLQNRSGSSVDRAASVQLVKQSPEERAVQRFLQRNATATLQRAQTGVLPVQRCGGEAHEGCGCARDAKSSQSQESRGNVDATPVVQDEAVTKAHPDSIVRQTDPHSVKEQTMDTGPATATLFETEEGTETLSARSVGTATVDGGTPDAGGADGGAPGGKTTNSCNLTGSFTSIPSGAIAATLSGTKLGATFNMIGQFTSNIPCTCTAGEYRQYVRGKFTLNGSPVTHALAGSNLSATIFQEDGAINGGTTYKYGYRSNPFANSNFKPDQATGCKFEGFDAPGIRGSSGDKLGVDLDFKGDLVDTFNSNSVLASSTWSVKGSSTLP